MHSELYFPKVSNGKILNTFVQNYHSPYTSSITADKTLLLSWAAQPTASRTYAPPSTFPRPEGDAHKPSP